MHPYYAANVHFSPRRIRPSVNHTTSFFTNYQIILNRLARLYREAPSSKTISVRTRNVIRRPLDHRPYVMTIIYSFFRGIISQQICVYHA